MTVPSSGYIQTGQRGRERERLIIRPERKHKRCHIDQHRCILSLFISYYIEENNFFFLFLDFLLNQQEKSCCVLF